MEPVATTIPFLFRTRGRVSRRGECAVGRAVSTTWRSAPRGDLSAARIYALHEPRNVVVSRVREGGARTVFEFLPDAHRDWYAVGRLDKDSEGLLLLCDDSRLAQRLMDPGAVAKRYLVTVADFPREEELEPMRRGGLLIEGQPARPAVGPLELDDLPESEGRELTAAEVAALRGLVQL